jgi:hypothetical protein
MGTTGQNPMTDKNVASRLIRLFLTALYDHEESMEKKKHTWLSSYNFVCLLNLPEQVYSLGPIRNRWEGGPRGEGFIRKVKPMVFRTGRENWKKNLLSNLLKHKSLFHLSEDGFNVGSSQTRDSLDLRCFKMYSCLTNFIKEFACHRPFSVVVDKRTLYGKAWQGMFVIYRSGSTTQLIHICPQETSTPKKFFGQIYHKISYVSQANDIDFEDLDVECYGLFLPLKGSPGYYSLVTDNWRLLDAEYHITAPHMYLEFSKKNWYD